MELFATEALNQTGTEIPSPSPIIQNPIISLIILAIVSGAWYQFYIPRRGNLLVDVPIVGPRNSSLARFYFFKQARLYVGEGYRNVFEISIDFFEKLQQ